jgi:hypothetical protein
LVPSIRLDSTASRLRNGRMKTRGLKPLSPDYSA